jgi:hypothetical protein
MMLGMADRGTSPMRLIVLTLGAGIIGISFLLLPLPHQDAWQWRAFYSVLFACGLVVSWLSEQRIKKNIRGGVWTEAQLAPVRRLVESFAWSAAIVAGFAVALFFVFYPTPGTPRSKFVPGMADQSMMRMSGIVRPHVERYSGLPDLRDVKPIESESWGESGHDSLTEHQRGTHRL